MRAHIKSQNPDTFNLFKTLDKLIEQNNYELSEKYLTVDLREYLTFQLDELKKCRDHVTKDLRIDYLTIQRIMDECYLLDPTMTGMLVRYNYKDVPKGNEFLGMITVNLFKK